ncbi:hypothetical protein BC830DRAFT_1153564 [Chytriomyces sp. MP71]|nr:hypothetical protein BC830DRAFT_1153564 [Chytriomyces sp. MP71]
MSLLATPSPTSMLIDDDDRWSVTEAEQSRAPTSEKSAMSSDRRSRTLPCISCQKARKRCDHGDPCSLCSRKGLVCFYSSAPRFLRNSISNPPTIVSNPSSPAPPSPPTSETQRSSLSAPEISLSGVKVATTKGSPKLGASATSLKKVPRITRKYVTTRPVPCTHCRSGKKRCDLTKPSCLSCKDRGLECMYIAAGVENQAKVLAALFESSSSCSPSSPPLGFEKPPESENVMSIRFLMD